MKNIEWCLQKNFQKNDTKINYTSQDNIAWLMI